jgi:hypothetical protein
VEELFDADKINCSGTFRKMGRTSLCKIFKGEDRLEQGVKHIRGRFFVCKITAQLTLEKCRQLDDAKLM